MKPKVKLMTLVWLCIAVMILYVEVHRRRTLAERTLDSEEHEDDYLDKDILDDNLEEEEEDGADDLPGYSYDDTSLSPDLDGEGADDADEDSDPGEKPAKLKFDDADDLDTVLADGMPIRLTLVDVKAEILEEGALEEDEGGEEDVQDGDDYENEEEGSAESWSMPAYEDDEDGPEGEEDEEEYESAPPKRPQKLPLHDSKKAVKYKIREEEREEEEAADSSGEGDGENIDDDKLILMPNEKQRKLSIDDDREVNEDLPDVMNTVKQEQKLAKLQIKEDAEEGIDEETEYDEEPSQPKLSLDQAEEEEEEEEENTEDEEYLDEESQPKLSLDLAEETEDNAEKEEQSETLNEEPVEKDSIPEPVEEPVVENVEEVLVQKPEDMELSEQLIEPVAKNTKDSDTEPTPANSPVDQSSVGDDRVFSPRVQLPVIDQSQRANSVNTEVESEAEAYVQAPGNEIPNLTLKNASNLPLIPQAGAPSPLNQQISSPGDTVYPPSATRAPQNALPSPQQSTPVKQSFFQYNYNYRSGASILRGKDLWLRKDLLHNLELLPFKYTQLNANTVKEFVFVTASAYTTFDSNLETIASIQHFFPRYKILYYDIGLLQDQEERVRAMCNVEYRPYYYDRYPKTIQNPTVTRQIHRAMIIQDAMRTYPGVFYIESPLKLLSSNLTSALALAITNGGLVFFSADSRGDALTLTNQDTFNFFPSTPMGLKSVLSMRNQAFLVYNTEKIFSSVLWWWYLCTLDGSCVPSTPCDLWTDPMRQQYADCRDFDQSVVNVLAANFYSFDKRWYFHQTPAVAAPARSDVIRVSYCKAPVQ